MCIVHNNDFQKVYLHTWLDTTHTFSSPPRATHKKGRTNAQVSEFASRNTQEMHRDFSCCLVWVRCTHAHARCPVSVRRPSSQTICTPHTHTRAHTLDAGLHTHERTYTHTRSRRHESANIFSRDTATSNDFPRCPHRGGKFRKNHNKTNNAPSVAHHPTRSATTATTATTRGARDKNRVSRKMCVRVVV